MKRRMLIALAIGATLLAVSGLAAGASGPNWDVSGTWAGNSGLVGNLAYHFVMNLTQTNGDVTGTFYYTNVSPEGTITGYVDGNDFYFRRTDTNQNYWATCWPCTISNDGTYFHGYGVDSGGRAVEWEAWGQATNPVMTVMVDIKPGSDPNSINLCSRGVVPVAVLSGDGFDATTIDPTTVVFAGADIRVKGKGALQYSLEDVDGDGDLDFVAQISVDNLDLGAGSTEATVSGMADGMPFEGTDSVNIVRDCE